MQLTLETQQVAQNIVDYIESNPTAHNQSTFWNVEANPDQEPNICDTTMCIAGTAVFMTKGVEGMIEVRKLNSADAWEQEGAQALGLTVDEANSLFYLMDNEAALDAVRALAQGDEAKFWEVIFADHETDPEDYFE